MILVDRLLLGGIGFVLDKIAAAVDTELNDEQRLREELLAAEMQNELGELSDEEFGELEAELLARLRVIRERQRGEREAGIAGRRRRRGELRLRRGGGPRVAAPAFHLYGGKGGVGKTTCAAAHALAAAAAGRRVLVVSTDPAHSLGDALGLKLGPTPTIVPTRRGALAAVELAAAPAWERWLGERREGLASLALRGTYLDREDVDRLFALPLPGVDELVGLLELARLARAEERDEVVVDTAPTAHTLRLLAMPEALRRFAGLLAAMQRKHRAVSEQLTGAWRPDGADALPAGIDAEAALLGDLLHDPRRARFHWVLLPEALSLAETRDALGELRESGVGVEEAVELVVNRVTPPAPEPCATCDVRRSGRSSGGERGGGCLSRVAGAIRAGCRARASRPRSAVRDSQQCRLRDPLAIVILSAAKDLGGGPAPPYPAIPSSLLDRLAPPGTRLLLFAGKGGTGKTTCAAAAALLLAERDPARPVLLLSTDPAHSLADVLSVPLDDSERPVTGAPPPSAPASWTPRRATGSGESGSARASRSCSGPRSAAPPAPAWRSTAPSSRACWRSIRQDSTSWWRSSTWPTSPRGTASASSSSTPPPPATPCACSRCRPSRSPGTTPSSPSS